VRIDAHISRSSAKTLPFTVRDVLFRLRVTILLSHAKINNVNDIRSLRSGTTNEEVVGFDITVYEIFLVDGLHSGDHLPCGHADGFAGELASTQIEEVLQAGTEEVDDQNVV
jgi:hypothetical protein